MARVVGIDWATQPENRALVALDVADDFKTCRVVEVATRVEGSAVHESCTNRENAVVAIDIPFGWPSAFSAFVSCWTPRAGTPQPPPTDEFRFRLTDRLVRDEARKVPLPVSADRIAMGVRAWTALVVEHALGARIDVTGTPSAHLPAIIEVYPGASARVLGRPSEQEQPEEEPSYKKNDAARRRLVERVASLFSVDLGAKLDQIVSVGEDSDEADALLAAVTGAIYLADCNACTLAGAAWRIRRPKAPSEVEEAGREGWIFFPVRS